MLISNVNLMNDVEVSAIRDKTVRLVAAYVAHNAVPQTDLSMLISIVHDALVAIESSFVASDPVEIDRPSQSRIHDSIRADGIISFLDGKTYKTLRRHLRVHGFHPDSYRERYGLPRDYPMTAPGYAAKRSQIARAMRLGHKID